MPSPVLSLQSFVACSAGIWMVGFVTLPFGVVDALVSFASGHVVGYTGRLPVFVAGTSQHRVASSYPGYFRIVMYFDLQVSHTFSCAYVSFLIDY